MKITVDVSASDYGHTPVAMSTGEKIWQLLKSIFGMDSSGHLAGVYWQAFILNCYLFIPLGFLVYLWLLCGDSSVPASSVGRDVKEGPSTTEKSESRTLAKSAAKSIFICVATSFAIEITQELTQELTHLGMFDINDILANSIGSCIGIGMVWQHVRGS